MSEQDPFYENADCGCEDCPEGDILQTQEAGFGKHGVIVRGEGEIKVLATMENGIEVFTVKRVPYAGPGFGVTIVPEAVERGNVFSKAGFTVNLSVAKGSEEVTQISSPEIGVLVSSPTLPYTHSQAWGDATSLGDTEVIAASLTVTDVISSYTKTATLVRTSRIWDGVINKDPRTATFQELMDAVTAFTTEKDAQGVDVQVKGKVAASANGAVTYPTANSYWFRVMRADWNPRMKSDLDFVPAKKTLGVLALNPNSGFAENLHLYCGIFRNSTPVTFTYF